MKAAIATTSVVPYKATEITIGATSVEFTYRPKRKTNHTRKIIGIMAFIGAMGVPGKKSKAGITMTEGTVYVREQTTLAELDADKMEAGALTVARGEENILVAHADAFSAEELIKVDKPKRKSTKKKSSKKSKKGKKEKKRRK